MNPKYQTLAEIEAAYPDRWVVINRPRSNRVQQVLGGFVIAHGSDREEVEKSIDVLPKPFQVAVLYMGLDIEPNMEYALWTFDSI